MYLYLISQDRNNDYDTYDSAVVCAESGDDAKTIHPGGLQREVIKEEGPRSSWDGWTSIQFIKVKYIGIPMEDLERGVICASYNAG